MTTQTVTQISAAARGKWPVILQMLRIDVPENGRHGPCPKCGGKDRFRLDDLDGRGTWICSQCGNGDGLDLVKLITGYGVRKAAQEVAQVLNVPDVQELPVKPARQKAPKPFVTVLYCAEKAARSCRTGSVLPRNISGMKNRYSATVRRRSRTSKYATRCA